MVDSRDSLLREVDSEVRREQLAKLWQRYGTYVLAGAVLIVAGVGGYKWYEASTQAAAQRSGSELAEALRGLSGADTADAQVKLGGLAEAGSRRAVAMAKLDGLTESGSGPVGLLAMARLAGEHAKAGKAAEALALYEKIAADTSADPLFRDFARLQIASLKLDGSDWTETKNRLNDLAQEGRPWRASARELIGIAALKAGQREEARQMFEQILSDAAAPREIAERVRVMMGLITTADAAGGVPAPGEPVKKP